MQVSAQSSPEVTVTGVTPSSGGVFPSGQSFYVRVAYESQKPLRLQAAGYLEGVKQRDLATNPSPVYAAGKGETVVWVFGQPGDRIDEMRVGVHDEKWQLLSEVPVPAQIEWQLGAPQVSTEPWAAEFAASQQRAVANAIREAPDTRTFWQKAWQGFATSLLPLAMLCVPGYLLLQAYAFWKLSGPVRLISATPLAFMVPVYVYSLYTLSQGSNLWPLYLLFTSPVAFSMTLAVVWTARRRAKLRVLQ